MIFQGILFLVINYFLWILTWEYFGNFRKLRHPFLSILILPLSFGHIFTHDRMHAFISNVISYSKWISIIVLIALTALYLFSAWNVFKGKLGFKIFPFLYESSE